MKYIQKLLVRMLVTASAAMSIFVSCSEIECPLDNIVAMQCNLYDATTGARLTINDTLSVTAAGRDTVLLNRAHGIDSFLLPLSHAESVDRLLLHWSSVAGERAVDTLFVTHRGEVHFESPDCPMVMFHQLGAVHSVRATGSSDALPAIDRIEVVNNKVEYEDHENIKIYLRGSSIVQ